MQAHTNLQYSVFFIEMCIFQPLTPSKDKSDLDRGVFVFCVMCTLFHTVFDDEWMKMMKGQCYSCNNVTCLLKPWCIHSWCQHTATLKPKTERNRVWCVCVWTHYADTDAVKIVRGEQLAEYAWGCSSSLLFDDTELSQCYDYAQFCSFACR